jgi:hypothetical protein
MAPRKNTRRLAFNSICLLLSGFGLGWLVGLSVSPVIQIILASLVAVVVSLSSALAGLRPSESEEEKDDSQGAKSDNTQGRKARRLFPIILDPLPVMTMVIGLACGASVGIYARANGWMSARTNIYVEEWKDTGLTPKEITTRVFDSLYPPPQVVTPGTQDSTPANPQTNQNDSGVQPAQIPATPQTGQQKEKNVGTPKSEQKPTATAERHASYRDTILFTVSSDQCTRLRNAEEEDELRREMASSNDDYLVSLSRTCKSYECLRAGANRACAKYK